MVFYNTLVRYPMYMWVLMGPRHARPVSKHTKSTLLTPDLKHSLACCMPDKLSGNEIPSSLCTCRLDMWEMECTGFYTSVAAGPHSWSATALRHSATCGCDCQPAFKFLQKVLLSLFKPSRSTLEISAGILFSLFNHFLHSTQIADMLNGSYFCNNSGRVSTWDPCPLVATFASKCTIILLTSSVIAVKNWGVSPSCTARIRHYSTEVVL
jgi:hypothetical protein